MKKLMIMLVTLLMIVSMTACGSDSSSDVQAVNANETGEAGGPGSGERPEGAEGEEDGEGPGDGAMPPGGDMGGMMEASVIPVTVATVSHESMKESLITNGKVMPYNEVTVGSDSSENIESLMVSIGDTVTEGDILYTFNMDETELSSKTQLVNASQTIETVKFNLENAQLDYDDTLQLYEKDYATESELESAEQVLKALELSYNQAVTDYSTTKEQTDYDLRNAIYYAPVSGTIAEMAAVENQRSSTSDFTIIDSDYYLIETAVSGDSIKDLSLGDEVTVTYETYTLMGTIDEIGVIGINDTDSYDVNVLVPKDEDVLRFGFSVDVQFTVKELDDQVVLPKKSILTDAYGDYVYIAVDGLVEKVSVEQGLTQDGYVQVFGDLNDGDAVITEGQYLVTEGGSVSLPGEELPSDSPEDMTRPELDSEEEPPSGEEGPPSGEEGPPSGEGTPPSGEEGSPSGEGPPEKEE